MDYRIRTVLVGLISVTAVLAIFILYNRISKEPHIDFNVTGQFIDSNVLGDISDVNNEIGKIADVGIVGLGKPVFRHISNGKVDREWGFEELSHQVEGQWEVEKPFINIYQPNFECLVTADSGKIQVDTTGGRPSPKDAILLGNVVIRILPQSGSDIKESSIYLDDAVFSSEKSLLSTAGPVKFVSQDANMLGRGLKLLYNNELEHLDLFRIIHVESIHLKGSQSGLFFRMGQNIERPAQDTVAGDTQKSKETPTTDREGVKSRRGEYYQCIISENVVIVTPEQLIFARDHVSIDNIFWQRASSKKSSAAEVADTNDVELHSLAVTRDIAPNKLAQESRDTVVTCDNGIIIIPMDSATMQNESDFDELSRADKLENSKAVSAKRPLPDFNNSYGRLALITERISYDVSTGDSVATGHSELAFLVNVSDSSGGENKKTAIPLKVTAQKEVRFLSASNQTIFEGDCTSVLTRTEPNDIQQKYTLSAPKLTASLMSHNMDNASMEHLVADGGVVRLRSVKTAKSKLLGGVELECSKIDYDASQELFVATGPGMIRLNNSKAAERKDQAGGLSLPRSCYAFLRDFATLKYSAKENRIIADAEPGGVLQVIYIPVVEGKYDQQHEATAAHAQIDLAQAADGQTELSTLTVSGGISYKEDQDNEFLGSRLFYDREKSVIKVWGGESNPCYYKGVLVDEIEYDLSTGKVKFQVISPSTL